MKKNKRRWISILLCFAMLFGILPVNAFADTPSIPSAPSSPADQIGLYYAADSEDGELAGVNNYSPTLAPTDNDGNDKLTKSYADDMVLTKKTITAGENENEFQITLDVRTKETIQPVELTEDAAVVLVIDLSGSMQNGSRLSTTKTAAKTFLTNFKSDKDGVQRKVAIVGFNGSDYNPALWGAKTYKTWTDASDSTVTTVIDNLSVPENAGTCLDAGLILAKNLLSDDAVSGIANKNIVLLTDGKPTYGLKPEANTTSKEKIGEPETGYWDGFVLKYWVTTKDDEFIGSGGSTTHAIHTGVEATAAAIENAGINVYAVYVGNQTVECEDGAPQQSSSQGRKRPNHNTCALHNNAKTGAQWLREDCGFVTYSVSDDNMTELSNKFKEISELIKFQAEAWKVTDPMGDMFTFNGFVEAPKNENQYYMTDDGNKIIWNLRLCDPLSEKENGYNVYQLSYNVTLNTLDEDFEANTFYPTNGVTSVTYYIVNKTTTDSDDEEDSDDEVDSRTRDRGDNDDEEDNDDENVVEKGTAYFNVPSAQGFVGEKEFLKVDDNGNALPGAKFKLTTTSGSITWSSGEVTSDTNGKVKFSNIPSGHTYTVTETAAPENYDKDNTTYPLTVAYGVADGIIGTNDNGTDKVKNTIKKGDLQISKTVTGEGADSNQEFDFTVTLKNGETPLEGTFNVTKTDSSNHETNSTLTFTTTGSQINLKHNESLTIKGIPVGTTYNVTETNVPVNYTCSNPNGITGTIVANGTATAAFTNTYAAPQVGSLKVSKVVSGITTTQAFTFKVTLKDASDKAVSGTFGDTMFDSNGEATISLAHSDSKTFTNIPAGTKYTVTETPNNDYNCSHPNGFSGTISENGEAKAEFTNTVKLGELQISKTVDGIGANKNKQFTFEVNVTMPNNSPLTGTYSEVSFNNGKATITLKDGEKKKIEGIPVGSTYTVTETANDNYTTTKSGDTGTIAVNGNAEAKFTNTLKTSSLTVTKKVEGTGAPEGDKFTFEVNVTMPNGNKLTGAHGDVTFTNGKATFELVDNGKVEITEIPVGSTYEVTEKLGNNSNYTVTAPTGGTATGTIAVGETTPIEFVNTYQIPENEFNFDIKKIVEADEDSDVDPRGNKTFNFVVSTSSDPTDTSAILAEPTITVNGVGTKTEDVSVSTTSSLLYVWEVAGNETGWTYDNTVETVTSDTEKVTFTNIYYEKNEEIQPEYGDLFVKKIVSDPNDEITTPQAFRFKVIAESLANRSFDAKGIESKVTFDKDGKYIFWLKDQKSLTICGLPIGTSYTVEEADYSDEYTTTVNEEPTNKTTGTISTTSSSVIFVNTWSKTTTSSAITTPGSLIVTKTVSGSVSTTEKFHFTVNASVADDSGNADGASARASEGLNGKYGDMTFKDGVATFTLKAGESKTASGLPIDTVFYVTEDESEDYTVTVNGTETDSYEGRIEDATPVTVTFNNHKDKTGGGGGGSVSDYGKITIHKTVTGDNAPAEDIPYAFTAWVRNSRGDIVSQKDVSYQITAADGKITKGTLDISKDGYTFFLKDGESITFGKISSGRQVEVQEITTGNFTTTSTGLDNGVCKISANRTKDVTFVNDYGNTKPPVEPEDPTEPSTPTQPITPATPEEPASSDFDDVPKTGDENGIGLWISIACLTLFGMAALAFGRKRFGTR